MCPPETKLIHRIDRHFPAHNIILMPEFEVPGIKSVHPQIMDVAQQRITRVNEPFESVSVDGKSMEDRRPQRSCIHRHRDKCARRHQKVFLANSPPQLSKTAASCILNKRLSPTSLHLSTAIYILQNKKPLPILNFPPPPSLAERV